MRAAMALNGSFLSKCIDIQFLPFFVVLTEPLQSIYLTVLVYRYTVMFASKGLATT